MDIVRIIFLSINSLSRFHRNCLKHYFKSCNELFDGRDFNPYCCFRIDLQSRSPIIFILICALKRNCWKFLKPWNFDEKSALMQLTLLFEKMTPNLIFFITSFMNFWKFYFKLFWAFHFYQMINVQDNLFIVIIFYFSLNWHFVLIYANFI